MSPDETIKESGGLQCAMVNQCLLFLFPYIILQTGLYAESMSAQIQQTHIIKDSIWGKMDQDDHTCKRQ